jgi:hypothetical protein
MSGGCGGSKTTERHVDCQHIRNVIYSDRGPLEAVGGTSLAGLRIVAKVNIDACEDTDAADNVAATVPMTSNALRKL